MAAFKIPKQKEIKRYATLFNVLAKYGFEDVLVNSGITKAIPKSYLNGHPDTEKKPFFFNIRTYSYGARRAGAKLCKARPDFQQSGRHAST
ncbi:hypothetical protein ACU8V7_20150 [Zobellia nedashkovskayae]